MRRLNISEVKAQTPDSVQDRRHSCRRGYRHFEGLFIVDDHVDQLNTAQHCHFLKIDKAVVEDVKYGWRYIRNELNSILDALYSRMDQIDAITSASTINELKLKQYRHWANLFTGSFSIEHIEQVRRSGITLQSLGLSPSDLILGYAFILDEMTLVLERRISNDPARLIRTIRAIHKLAAIDMSIALCAYDVVLID